MKRLCVCTLLAALILVGCARQPADSSASATSSSSAVSSAGSSRGPVDVVVTVPSAMPSTGGLPPRLDDLTPDTVDWAIVAPLGLDEMHVDVEPCLLAMQALHLGTPHDESAHDPLDYVYATLWATVSFGLVGEEALVTCSIVELADGSYFIDMPEGRFDCAEAQACKDILLSEAAGVAPIPLDYSYRSLKTSSDDLLAIAETLYRQEKDRFFGDDVPDYYRLRDYYIQSMRLVAGDKEEFCVSFVHDYRVVPTDRDPYGTFHFSANGGLKEEGSDWWVDNYTEYRIKRTAPDTYTVVSIGTGGGAQGLAEQKDGERVIRERIAR